MYPVEVLQSFSLPHNTYCILYKLLWMGEMKTAYGQHPWLTCRKNQGVECNAYKQSYKYLRLSYDTTSMKRNGEEEKENLTS